MPGMELNILAQKLYSYNTIPIPLDMRSKHWEHHSIFPASPLYTDAEKLLRTRWVPETVRDGTNYWLSWRPEKKAVHGIRPGGFTFKLYISPHIDDYLPVLSETIKILTASNAYCFKTGSNYHGILRPDKLVVYFDNLEELKNTAGRINNSTSNFLAQGVPFSAPIFDTLMLSWGIDPPAGKKDAVSWRSWITRELATGIIEGKRKLVGEPWQYALQYIRSKGFKTDTWEPDEMLFSKTQSLKN